MHSHYFQDAINSLVDECRQCLLHIIEDGVLLLRVCRHDVL